MHNSESKISSHFGPLRTFNPESNEIIFTVLLFAQDGNQDVAAAASVHRQSLANWELVVVNPPSGSTELSRELCTRIATNTVLGLELGSLAEFVASRQSKYLAFLQQGTIWHAERLAHDNFVLETSSAAAVISRPLIWQTGSTDNAWVASYPFRPNSSVAGKLILDLLVKGKWPYFNSDVISVKRPVFLQALSSRDLTPTFALLRAIEAEHVYCSDKCLSERMKDHVFNEDDLAAAASEVIASEINRLKDDPQESNGNSTTEAAQRSGDKERGNLEAVGYNFASGWAALGDRGAAVELRVNGKSVGVAQPDIDRPDVTAHHGISSVCGFHFKLPAPAAIGRVVSAHFPSGRNLPGSPWPAALDVAVAHDQMKHANLNKPLSIREFLDREGSDKGRWYGGLYDVLLQPTRDSIRCVIEIGIGTLIPDAPSSMVGWASDQYRPGGSLRAWRDFFPNAIIYGLDVALDTQIDGEPRIKTHICDSTNQQQAEAFLSGLALTPDLIVDDGLHHPDAQISTLRNFFPALRSGGLYVVEDVTPAFVEEIIKELERTHPTCPWFVDRSWRSWFAIVIRKPEREEMLSNEGTHRAEVRLGECTYARAREGKYKNLLDE